MEARCCLTRKAMVKQQDSSEGEGQQTSRPVMKPQTSEEVPRSRITVSGWADELWNDTKKATA